MSNILEVKGLSKDYALMKKNPEPDAFALKDVTFSVPKGFIMGLAGPNGAGKTTALKLILQIRKRDAGTIQMFGRDISESSKQNDMVGVVLDTPNFPHEWRLTQVEQGLRPFYKSWDSAKFAESLENFELSPKKTVMELSRGMQVKLQIAIAISHNAKFLVLDEPTGGLDPVARDEVCEIMQEFVEDGEKSVLFSTHITSDLEKIADYVTMILKGKIHYTGTKDHLLDRYARITGGADDITEAHIEKIIGYRKHGAGFEGLLKVSDKPFMPSSVLTEAPTLEDIIVFINKESKKEAKKDA